MQEDNRHDDRLRVHLGKGRQGFQAFLRYTMFEADTAILNFDNKDIKNVLEKADSYVIYKRIRRLYQELLDQLNEDERKVVNRIRHVKIRHQEYASVYSDCC